MNTRRLDYSEQAALIFCVDVRGRETLPINGPPREIHGYVAASYANAGVMCIRRRAIIVRHAHSSHIKIPPLGTHGFWPESTADTYLGSRSLIPCTVCFRKMAGIIHYDLVLHHISRASKAFRSMVMHGNPWWSRIWTVQEAVLPPSASVVWYSLSIPWITLDRAAANMCDATIANILPMFAGVAMQEYDDLIENLLYPVRGLSISKIGQGLLNVLQRWRYREATDPRDKVYALMGLFPHMPFPSVQLCSYDISPVTLYARVTIDLIRLEQGLRPLVGFRGEPHVTANLPTWTLDLTRYDYSSSNNRRRWKWWNHSHRYKMFAASGNSSLEWPPNIHTTDEVWVLYGGKVPFVLRPNEARTPGVVPSNSLSFVGDAYAHGIMDGQAVNEDAGRKMTVLLS
ncbi:hypothetical protein DL98DRAFT_610493 [Cadophora sp. DSE1049]|nr:hypothetical protein DL98DRAFT_610493 [Cadophora sp. DSE1049]